MNRKLDYKAQYRVIKSKNALLQGAFKRLIQSTWGYSLNAARTLYLSAIRPVLTYGALAWFPYQREKELKTLKEALNNLQGCFLRAIAGAYKATAKEALEIELYIEPLDLYIEKTAIKSLSRLTSQGYLQDIQQFSQKIRNFKAKRRPRIRKKIRIPSRTSISLKNKELYRIIKDIESRGTPILLKPLEIESYKKEWRLYKERLDLYYLSKWKEKWENIAKGREIAKYYPEPTEKALELYINRPRIASTAIIQLRTAKIGLKLFLYKRKVPNIDPLCECGLENESVEHFLLKCSKWAKYREDILEDYSQKSTKDILSNRQGSYRAARFLIATKRLEQFSQTKDLEAEEEPKKT